MNRRRAFTLVELLVVMGMMVVIMIVLIGMYKGARGSFEYGNQRVGLQQRCREALKRVSVLLVSGIDSGATEGAIHRPAAVNPNPNPVPTAVLFCTTEDFLNPETPVPPGPANRSKNWDPITQPLPPVFRYQIAYEPVVGANPPRGNLVLRRDTGVNITLGPAPDFVEDVSVPPRTLATSDEDPKGARLTNATFIKLANNSVQVTVTYQGTIRSQSGQERDVTYELDSVVQLPAVDR